MSFTDAIKTCFSNYCNFNGRARRIEYWYYMLFNLTIRVILAVIQIALIFGSDGSPFIIVLSVLQWIYCLGVLLPELGVSVRRLHDTGRNGWFYLLRLFPLLGSIVLIVFFAQDSQFGINKYGPNPKDIGNEETKAIYSD